MRPTALCLMVLAMLTALGGCGEEKLLKRGDEAMMANRAGEAARFYQQALEKQKKLAQDPEFVAKLTRAKCLAAYQAGETLAQQGDWEQAALRFADSLQIDSTFEDARRALEQAKPQAAKVRYRKALDAADQGRLDEAAAHLKRALELDPQHRDAQAALASVADPRGAGVRADLDRGLALARDRKWAEAAEVFRGMVAASPNFLPARAELGRAGAAIEQARRACSDGARLLEEKRLDEAVSALKTALDIWPAYADAATLLAQAETRRQEAEDLYTTAERYAAGGQWDDAIRSAAAALDKYPSHAGARALAGGARDRAAAAHVQAGQALLARNQLAEAEQRFLKALGYVADLADAKDGLARADLARGQADEQRGLWGSALVWYTSAAEHSGARPYADRLRAAEAQVRGRIATGLALDAPRADAATAGAAAALRARVLQALSGARPEFVRLVDARAPAGQAAYAATVGIIELNIRMRPVRTEPRVHRYAVGREVPNPEVPRLRHLLAAAQADLARMQREFLAPCPVCHGRGAAGCAACGGTGRASRISRRDIERQEMAVRRIHADLAAQPPILLEQAIAEWPYAVEVHEKTGGMAAALEVRRTGDGRIVRTDMPRADVRYEDATVVNPNPAIGLGPKPLVFPPDGEVLRALVEALAPDLAGRILEAAVADFAAEVRAAMERFQRDGKTVEAVEAAVDLAMLLRGRAGGESDRILRELQAQRRTH